MFKLKDATVSPLYLINTLIIILDIIYMHKNLYVKKSKSYLILKMRLKDQKEIAKVKRDPIYFYIQNLIITNFNEDNELF